MRLKLAPRTALLIIGLGFIAFVIVGAVKGWSAAYSVPTLALPGVFFVLAGVVGVLPGGSLKDGALQWPDAGPYERADEDRQLDDVRRELEELRTGTAQELEKLKAAHRELDDIVLAREPEPNDGLTNDRRLEEGREQCEQLDQEIAHRQFTGDYDDGINLHDLIDTRDKARKWLEREERRQSARARFGGESQS